MRAIVVKEFGSADHLALAALPDPAPGAGEVVIAVEAAGVGLVDVLQRQGHLGASPGFVPGIEVAGRVAGVGAGVDGALLGKRVFAHGPGGYAERFVAEAGGLVELPDAVSAEAAVALGINALVARFSLLRAGLRAGERVLVRGASGGIGALATEMAVRLGAEVTAVTNAGAAERVAALGAHHVIRRGLDPEPEGPFDGIVDPVAGEAMLALIGKLAPNGRYVVNGAAAGFPPAEIGGALLKAFSKSPTYALFSLDSVPPEDRRRAATELFAEAARGALRPVIAEVLPLRDAATAHKMLEAGASFGKVVLKP